MLCNIELLGLHVRIKKREGGAHDAGLLGWPCLLRTLNDVYGPFVCVEVMLSFSFLDFLFRFYFLFFSLFKFHLFVMWAINRSHFKALFLFMTNLCLSCVFLGCLFCVVVWCAFALTNANPPHFEHAAVLTVALVMLIFSRFSLA